MGKINLSPVDGRRDEAFRVDERKQSRLPATFVRRSLVRSLSLPRRVRIQMKDDLDSQPFRRRHGGHVDDSFQSCTSRRRRGNLPQLVRKAASERRKSVYIGLQ